MRAGKLTQWVRFVKIPEVPLRNELGEEVSQDVTVHECHAAVEPLEAREFMAAQQGNAEISHKVSIRYVPGIHFEQTILYGTRRFNIVSIIDLMEGHRELEILAKETL